MQAGTGAAASALRAALNAGDAAALAAQLAAIGPPGSPQVLAALAEDGLLLPAASWQYGCAELPLFLAAVGPPGSPAVIDALSKDRHALLHNCCFYGNPDALAATLAAYGAPGSAAVLRALATPKLGHRRSPLHAVLSATSEYAVGRHFRVEAVLAAFGPPGCAAVRAALSAGDHRALYLETDAHMGYDRILAALLAALGPPGCAAVRRTLDARDGDILIEVLQRANIDRYGAEMLDARRLGMLDALLGACCEPGEAAAARVGAYIGRRHGDLSFIRCPDGLLARLAVQMPEAWRLGNAAQALLTAPTRAALALPTLLAVRRLPEGVAKPLAAFLRSHPWLLYAGAAGAEMEAG
jgi:hypothetical protein